ncbi:lipopolysaccharide/colanic/teichoic acid biosynthesis glycosyltransferase [Aliiruegeria haliotis]|uniref:Lipopolysaccharide/colanic/teichoic acid biosynthesis glycosyltransferase n=1 Tax=Aliiruegeria haliotis TaxID=1280846 RepID=A0A2T0S0A4_9RHOB|nr:sugar transferase [Aliiruegeria haliotis]PRY26830.1 lipopolysaccharide/colanic/teichoic acid biosynthesis glycosyltransferase [Aliiruegeria haliotis]
MSDLSKGYFVENSGTARYSGAGVLRRLLAWPTQRSRSAISAFQPSRRTQGRPVGHRVRLNGPDAVEQTLRARKIGRSDVRQPIGLASRPLAFRFCKRAIDLFGAISGLFFLAPFLITCAIAIKATSRGPVFFRQDRYGLNGQLFSIYKFRTMRVHQGDTSGVKQTTRGDPRITPLGRVLRKTSFDELPQLINVLQGTMSLVGPRPHVPNMIAAGVRYEDFDPRYMDRHTMLPGITGLAQVHGFRGETLTYASAKGRIDKDIEYARTATIAGDIRILLQTVRREFLSGNGY